VKTATLLKKKYRLLGLMSEITRCAVLTLFEGLNMPNFKWGLFVE